MGARCWSPACLCACVPACACLCLPVPVPVARLSMPDIISSKGIWPASKSRLVFQCISFVLRKPYQDIRHRLRSIPQESFSSSPCCAKQSSWASDSFHPCWARERSHPSIGLPSFPRSSMGPCSLLLYKVTAACVLLCNLLHSWFAVWLAWCLFTVPCCPYFRSLFVLVVASFVASLVLLFRSALLISPFPLPMSSALLLVLFVRPLLGLFSPRERAMFTACSMTSSHLSAYLPAPFMLSRRSTSCCLWEPEASLGASHSSPSYLPHPRQTAHLTSTP